MRVELLQDAGRFLGIGHHRAFGELELQAARIEAGILDSAGGYASRLPCRNCEAVTLTATRSGGRPSRCHALALPAGFAQHPFADGVDEPAFLGERDEVLGHDHAALRMPPADQRFGAVEVVGRGIDLRLVVQLELLLRQRVVQIALELDALARVRVHAGLEALHVVAAALLGAVHRRIGVRDQAVRRRAIGRIERDADAAWRCAGRRPRS